MTMRYSKPLKQLLGSALALVGLAQMTLACAFHGYTPRPTLIDILYDSEQVMLARPDPAAPKRYRPVQALMGGLDMVEVPHTPDAATRAQLRATPQAAVLFARDGSYGPWVAHGVIDPSFRMVLETALTQQNRWQGGTGKARAQFFAGLLRDPNPDLRELALLELDRVDYATLRSLKIKGLSAQVAALQSGDPKLRPIRILLTGLSKDKTKVAILSEGLARATQKNRRHLGAYATALIELAGAKAVTTLQRSYLADAGQPVTTKELIIEAMALQGLYGSRAVKRAITREMEAVLRADPSLAGPVARQFSRHGNWSLGRAVADAQAAAPPSSAKDAVPMAKYIAFAAKGTGQ